MKSKLRIALLALIVGMSALDAQSYRVLKSFDGAADGGHPLSALVEGDDGYLYGTTSTNGLSGAGTIFKLDKSGTNFLVLHAFGAAGGWKQSPSGPG